MILRKSIETRKPTQVLNMPKKAKKELLTNKVERFFVASLFTPITCTSFAYRKSVRGVSRTRKLSRLTEFSRMMVGSHD